MPRSYSSLLRDPQFAGLFVTQVCTVLATSISGLYLGTIVNEQTGSPFLTSFAMFAPSLANIISAASVMSIADTAAPRVTMVMLQVGIAGAISVQAFPLPLWVRFVMLLLSGALTAISAGIRLGLISLTVGAEGYAPARSLLNLTNGAIQVSGFAFGAVLLDVVDPFFMFVVLGVLMLIAALVVGITVRPFRSGADKRSFRRVRRQKTSALGVTHAVNAWILRQPSLRVLLIALWVPNGMIVGAESLFIPYAGDQGGYLLAAGAAGMVLGDLFVGRVLTRRMRWRVNLPQRVLLALPYLCLFFMVPWQVATILAFVASLGFSASLGLQERLVSRSPENSIGQIQGLESSGRVAAQGVFALGAGGVAELTGAGTAIAMMAAASLLVTLLLVIPLRRLAAD